MKYIKIMLLICLLCQPFVGWAQQVIRGKVADEKEKTGIERVVVKLSVNGQMKAYALTNERGEYELRIPADVQQSIVSFEHLSYDRQAKEITNRSQTLDVWLREKAVQLHEVTVSVPHIKLKGDTLAYRLSAFVGKGDISLEDAMKKLPGIDVTPAGTIQYMGRNINQFYIEGMDMLKGKYSLATRNLSANSVTEVEIIENHQEIKQQQNRIYSDDVAVNIKLSQKAQFKPFGTSEATLGYGEEGLLYHLGLTGMMFSPHFQTISTAKIGNYRPSSDSELTNHFDYQGMGNKAFNLLDISSMGSASPPVKESRYKSVQDKMISANTMHKLSGNSTLTLNLSYSYARNQHSYHTQSHYYTNEGSVTFSEESNPLTKTHRPEFSLNYKLNDSTLYLQNNFVSRSRFEKNLFDVHKNQQVMGQYREARQIDLSNDLQINKRLGEHFWDFSSYMQYTTSPRNRLLFSDTESDGGKEISQTAAGKTFYTKEEAKFTLTTSRYSRIYFPLSFSLTYDELDTQLLRLAESAEDSNNGYHIHTSFAPRYEWRTSDNRYLLHLTVPLSHYFLDYWGQHREKAHQKNYFYIDPVLYFNYTVNSYVKLNLYTGVRQSLGDILDFLGQPIQTSYRTQQLSSGILTKNRREYADLRFEYKRPLEFWFANASVNYGRNRYNTLSSQWVDAENVITSRIISPHTSQDISSTGSITKQFQSIRTKITLGGSYSWRKDQILQQNIQTPYYGQVYSAWGSLTARPWSWSELVYSARVSQNNNRYLNQHFSLLTQSHTAKLSAFLSKGLNLYTEVEFDRREIESSRYKNITLYDAGMQYKLKSCRLQLQLNNILNVKSYSYTLFTGLDSFSYNYQLRGRELLFSVILFQ